MVTVPFTLSLEKSYQTGKNGFLALFLVFFIFELLQTRLSEEQWAITKTWQLVMLIFSAVSYLAIKLYKRKF